MKNRFLTIGATMAAVALALTGCGGKTAGPTTGGEGGGSISSGMIFGGPPEFKTRTDGIPGLKRVYNVEFGQYKVTDVGGPVTVNALKRGQVDAADLFTTDPSISANGFVVLEDDQHMFAAQNIVPIIAKDKVTDGVKTVLNGIQAKLTTDGLIEMNSKVSNEKQDPAAVAKAWLADNGLDASGTSAKGVSLTVGSANFPENVILAEIYAGALEAQGATIEKKLNIGSREKYYPALKAGSLDLFPEYTGTILTYIDKTSDATTPDDVYAALAKALPSNLIALDKAEAQNSDAVVVAKETADKFKLKTIADLAEKG